MDNSSTNIFDVKDINNILVKETLNESKAMIMFPQGDFVLSSYPLTYDGNAYTLWECIGGDAAEGLTKALGGGAAEPSDLTPIDLGGMNAAASSAPMGGAAPMGGMQQMGGAMPNMGMGMGMQQPMGGMPQHSSSLASAMPKGGGLNKMTMMRSSGSKDRSTRIRRA